MSCRMLYALRQVLLLLLLLVLSSAVEQSLEKPSTLGCAKGQLPAAGLHRRTIVVDDFEPVQREYWIQVPEGIGTQLQPFPLLMAFHGQAGTGEEFANDHNFSEVGRQHGLIAVYPTGMNDSFPGEEQDSGWNAGSAGDNETCVPEGVGDSYGCYQSCRKLKQCGRCNWSTCYDDVLFVRNVISAVAEEICIDLDRVYAQGESNGGEMVHRLIRQLPGTFAGISTWFGTPLLGYLLGKRMELINGRSELSRTAILALHGRNDTTIPAIGGVTDSGWIFEPLEQSTGIWAFVHQCDEVPTPLTTKWDGGPLNFRCHEYLSCSSCRRVVECMYDGVHGDWPTGKSGEEITLWLLLRFSRRLDFTCEDSKRDPFKEESMLNYRSAKVGSSESLLGSALQERNLYFV